MGRDLEYKKQLQQASDDHNSQVQDKISKEQKNELAKLWSSSFSDSKSPVENFKLFASAGWSSDDQGQKEEIANIPENLDLFGIKNYFDDLIQKPEHNIPRLSENVGKSRRGFGRNAIMTLLLFATIALECDAKPRRKSQNKPTNSPESPSIQKPGSKVGESTRRKPSELSEKKRVSQIVSEIHSLIYNPEYNSNGENEIKELLETIKDQPDLLRKVLLQCDNTTPPLLYQAAINNQNKAIKEILGTIKEPTLLREVLMQSDPSGLSALSASISRGCNQATKDILIYIKDRPELFEDVLTKGDNNGISPLHVAVHTFQNAAVTEILGLIKNKPLLLKKLLMQVRRDTLLNAFSKAVFEGNSKAIKLILNAIQPYPEILSEIIRQDSKIKPVGRLSILANLAIAGNDAVIVDVLKIAPDASLEKLSKTYYTEIPNNSIHYLEAFLKSDQTLKGFQASYFKFDGLTSSEMIYGSMTFKQEESSTTIISLKNADTTERKVILASSSIKCDCRAIKDQDYFSQAQKIFLSARNLANSQKTNEILFEVDIIYGDGLHSVVARLKRDSDADKKWNLEIFDSNASSKYGDEITKSRKNEESSLAYKENLISIFGNSLSRNSPNSVMRIIPNYTTRETPSGACAIISSMTIASLILGEDHVKSVARQCDKSEKRCGSTITDLLHPHLQASLEARVERVRTALKPSTSTTPSKHQKLPATEREL